MPERSATRSVNTAAAENETGCRRGEPTTTACRIDAEVPNVPTAPRCQSCRRYYARDSQSRVTLRCTPRSAVPRVRHIPRPMRHPLRPRFFSVDSSVRFRRCMCSQLRGLEDASSRRLPNVEWETERVSPSVGHHLYKSNRQLALCQRGRGVRCNDFCNVSSASNTRTHLRYPERSAMRWVSVATEAENETGCRRGEPTTSACRIDAEGRNATRAPWR